MIDERLLYRMQLIAVRQAFDAICTAAHGYAPQAEIHGVLVQSMVRPDLEMVAGIVQDADFGPMVMVGFGGVYVEVLDDTVLAPAPLSHADAHAMLRKLRGYPILTGARGRAPRDLDALCTVLVQLSQLAVSSQGLLAELDLNPIFLREQGAGLSIVDALGIRSSPHA